MNDEREPMEARSVTMTPENWAQVEKYGRKMKIASISASVRRIVDEWWELRGRKIVDTGELVLLDLEPPSPAR